MLIPTPTARPPKPARKLYRPVLEVLEDRRLLSSFFQQTNLVADEPGVAVIHDPSLVNAWGISLSLGGGAVWVSANGTGVTTLYTGDVNGSPILKSGLTVTLPGGAPAGQVFNTTPSNFTVTSGGASGRSIFIFASEAGFITGWNPAVPLPPPSRVSQVAVNLPGQAVFTGLAIGSNAAGDFLYAADFKSGTIQAFNSSFVATDLPGEFVDPGIPDSFAPFNVQNLGGKLYVTYARADRSGEGRIPEQGSGFVSVFDTDGNFLQRLASRGPLSAPWGLALAPADFGEFGGAVLVGNHANGRINAFHPDTGRFLGQLRDERERPIRIDGLFGLQFGNGISFGDRNALYFAAGPDDGTDGLFGSLRVVQATPEEDDDEESERRGGSRRPDGDRFGGELSLLQTQANLGTSVRVTPILPDGQNPVSAGVPSLKAAAQQDDMAALELVTTPRAIEAAVDAIFAAPDGLGSAGLLLV